MDQQPVKQKKDPIGQWIALIVLIMIVGGLLAFVIAERSDSDDLPPQTAQVPTSSTTPTPAQVPPATIPEAIPPAQKSVYKDGTYSATGTYVSPGGEDLLDVTLVLKSDVVTDVQIGVKAQNPTSKKWQTYFAESVGAVTVGKKIDDIQLDAVSGSSLTPIGFMDALAQIKAQAKV